MAPTTVVDPASFASLLSSKLLQSGAHYYRPCTFCSICWFRWPSTRNQTSVPNKCAESAERVIPPHRLANDSFNNCWFGRMDEATQPPTQTRAGRPLPRTNDHDVLSLILLSIFFHLRTLSVNANVYWLLFNVWLVVPKSPVTGQSIWWTFVIVVETTVACHSWFNFDRIPKEQIFFVCVLPWFYVWFSAWGQYVCRGVK